MADLSWTLMGKLFTELIVWCTVQCPDARWIASSRSPTSATGQFRSLAHPT